MACQQRHATHIYNGKQHHRSLKRKAIEDVGHGMTSSDESVDSNSEMNIIQTTKNIRGQTETLYCRSEIISFNLSEEIKFYGMKLRSSEGKKQKMLDEKQEDYSKLTDVEDATCSKPLKTGNQPAADADPWIRSIITNNRKTASNALKHGLPNQSQLDDLVKHFGRKSKLMFGICDKICCSVRERDKRIVSVWAAYSADKTDQDQISFVVVVKEDIELEKDYRFVKRKQGHVNDEGKNVLNSKDFDKYHSNMTVNEIQNIRKSINKNNNKLMEQHKYLTIISGSPVRSKGYGGTHTIKREPCIVLYVFVKGYIPINEERFQTKYDGVSVDVREGLFMFNAAKDYQKPLKHGCQIERYLCGTLGGFITHREFGTCGLTSAHVLLTPEEFNNFGPKKTVQNWNNKTTDNTVYQPSRRSGHSCGMLVRAIHDKGGGGKSGMNIAVFQVEERYPENGEFPCLTDGRPSEMRFDSGQTVGDTRLGFGPVSKFGAATEITTGNVLFNAPILSVKLLPEHESNIGGKYVYRLHNLFEVRTATVSGSRQIQTFASFGDSGALVFCRGEAGRLTCLGMLEGSVTHGTHAVMPIAPILERLQITGMKSFERNKLEEKIDNGFENMNTKFQSMEQTNERRFQSIEAKVDQIYSAIQSNQRR